MYVNHARSGLFCWGETVSGFFNFFGPGHGLLLFQGSYTSCQCPEILEPRRCDMRISSRLVPPQISVPKEPGILARRGICPYASTQVIRSQEQIAFFNLESSKLKPRAQLQ
jgi:hypothetical protein